MLHWFNWDLFTDPEVVGMIIAVAGTIGLYWWIVTQIIRLMIG